VRLGGHLRGDRSVVWLFEDLQAVIRSKSLRGIGAVKLSLHNALESKSRLRALHLA